MTVFAPMTKDGQNFIARLGRVLLTRDFARAQTFDTQGKSDAFLKTKGYTNGDYLTFPVEIAVTIKPPVTDVRGLLEYRITKCSEEIRRCERGLADYGISPARIQFYRDRIDKLNLAIANTRAQINLTP